MSITNQESDKIDRVYGNNKEKTRIVPFAGNSGTETRTADIGKPVVGWKCRVYADTLLVRL